MTTNEMTTVAVKCCPHCEQELSEQEIKTLWANYTSSRRQTLGAPKRMKRACFSCGTMCSSAREAWSHCRIPRGLDAEALLAYVLSRMPEELVGALKRMSEALGTAKRFDSLEALQDALIIILHAEHADLAVLEKRQAEWFASFVDKAMGKLEDVA